MLAGVIRGPSLLNPFRSMENAKDIQDESGPSRRLGSRHLEGGRSGEVPGHRPGARRTSASPQQITRSRRVFDLLEDYLAPHLIETGGLRIHTTIESGLQQVAQSALDAHLSTIERIPGYAHAPRSSHRDGTNTITSRDRSDPRQPHRWHRRPRRRRDFGESSFNRAFSAKRQVGIHLQALSTPSPSIMPDSSRTPASAMIR